MTHYFAPIAPVIEIGFDAARNNVRCNGRKYLLDHSQYHLLPFQKAIETLAINVAQTLMALPNLTASQMLESVLRHDASRQEYDIFASQTRAYVQGVEHNIKHYQNNARAELMTEWKDNAAFARQALNPLHKPDEDTLITLWAAARETDAYLASRRTRMPD